MGSFEDCSALIRSRQVIRSPKEFLPSSASLESLLDSGVVSG